MNATTKILALACAGLLALAGTASAHHGASSATVYGAKLTAPGATTTTTTTDPATAIRGKALLVDGSQNNVLSVHVRNLTPNTAYTFELSSAPPDQAEALVADFASTTATTNEDGKLRGFVKSATFNAADGATYSVLVKQGDTVVASGQLQALPFHKRFGHRRGHKHGHRGDRQHSGFEKSAQGASGAQSGDPGHGCDGDKGEQS